MPALCFIGFHSWDGCKCTRCGLVRDELHRWDFCTCKRCGQRRDNHDWNNCKCQVCGKTKDEDHYWRGCRCEVCEKVRDESHSFSKYICQVCGKIDPLVRSEIIKRMEDKSKIHLISNFDCHVVAHLLKDGVNFEVRYTPETTEQVEITEYFEDTQNGANNIDYTGWYPTGLYTKKVVPEKIFIEKSPEG